jgi:hypothetical protein
LIIASTISGFNLWSKKDGFVPIGPDGADFFAGIDDFDRVSGYSNALAQYFVWNQVDGEVPITNLVSPPLPTGQPYLVYVEKRTGQILGGLQTCAPGCVNATMIILAPDVR